MTLSTEEVLELRGYLKADDLDTEDIAEILGCHRTTISKKLSGAVDMPAIELVRMGRKIEKYVTSAQQKRAR